MQDAVDALYAAKKTVRGYQLQPSISILPECALLTVGMITTQAVGSGPCVGVVGATLGAGLGRLQGLYGFMSDSLLSVRIMLPNMTVVEASEQANSDLFWGIRGAGFNFGFILNATYRVYDEAPHGQNFNADFQFALNSTPAFYTALRDHAPAMPGPLCVSTFLQWNPVYEKVSLSLSLYLSLSLSLLGRSLHVLPS